MPTLPSAGMTGAADIGGPPSDRSSIGEGTVPEPRAGRIALGIEGVPSPVLLVDAAEVAGGLRKITRGWVMNEKHPSGQDLSDHASQVRGTTLGFDVISSFDEASFDGLPLASAVCAVLADLGEARVAALPETTFLHAGAIELQGQAIALVGGTRAGKSTLIARFGAETDLKIYCDDILPIHPDGTAEALGVAPRVRLPLPAGISEDFRAHVAGAAMLSDDTCAFLPTPNLATSGTSAPLGVIVWLDRRQTGGARFHHVPPSDALGRLRQADMQNPADTDAQDMRLSSIIAGAVCLELVYSDIEEAVAVIRHVLGGTAPVQPGGDAMRPRNNGSPVGDLVLARDGLAIARPAPAGLWITARPSGQMIRLNPVGAAVWALLELPATCSEIAEDLCSLFPDVPPARIAADTEELLARMLEAGLVRPADRLD